MKETILDLYVDSDNDIRQFVKNDRTGEPVSNATVTFAVKDKDGATITGGTGTCTLISGSTTGEYLGTLQKTADLVVNEEYWVEITITEPGGLGDFRRVHCRAVYRGTV